MFTGVEREIFADFLVLFGLAQRLALDVPQLLESVLAFRLDCLGQIFAMLACHFGQWQIYGGLVQLWIQIQIGLGDGFQDQLGHIRVLDHVYGQHVGRLDFNGRDLAQLDDAFRSSHVNLFDNS